MRLDLVLALVGVFGSVALLVGTITSSLLAKTAPERRRLERAGLDTSTSGVLFETPVMTPVASPFAKLIGTILPKSKADAERLRRRFLRAGYDGLTPIALFTLAQALLPLLLSPLMLWFGSVRSLWPVMGLVALAAYLLPSLILDRQTRVRQKTIQNGLPDALDLMIVCLEAGSAIDQAILKVGDELDLAYPPLASEFKLVVTETRAGKGRIDAFRAFADRTGVEDVRSLVAMLVQTDRFGTSIAQALRTLADTARSKRRQRAEEAAAKIGVKLVFPLVFFLFPAFFVVTLGPSVIEFSRVLFSQVSGQ